MLKNSLIAFLLLLTLTACGGGDSDSGAMVEPTLPGTNVPANFAGTYTGTLTVTASAAGLTETDSFPITVTVTDDAMVRFDGDDPDETFTVGLENDGTFRGNLPIEVDDCSGNLSTTGQVDGTRVTGEVNGSGECDVGILSVDVTLEGTFEATR